MKREDGFYWVKCLSKWSVWEYEISQDNGRGYWFCRENNFRYYDDEFEEIDERRIERQTNK